MRIVEDIWVAASVRIFGWQFTFGYLGGSFSDDLWVAVLVRICGRRV